MSSQDSGGRLYGLMAEFETPGALIAATEKSREAGYRKLDAYAPYPIEELVHALGHHHSKLPLMVLGGGIVGCLAGLGLQVYVNAFAYPLNIGGKPVLSWPAFVPVTFEMTILCASLTAVLGMLALNGLPTPYHPVFNLPRFSAASRDRYFLCIEATDPRFHPEGTRQFLEAQSPTEVSEVEY
jgi:Alternative complex III, ActD subunit